MEEQTRGKAWLVRALRGFAKWVLLPVIVLSASIALVAIGWNYYQEYRDRDLAAAKTWPPQPIPFNQAEAILKTSWRGASLYYQFRVTPVSEEILTRYRKRNVSRDRAFFLDFEDGSGFKLGRVNIDLDKMTQIVNDKGQLDSLEIKDSTYFERASYKEATHVSVGWSSVFDEIVKEIEREKTAPKVITETKPVSQLSERATFFTVGSSKDEVLRIQGQPTSTSKYMWWYGTSYVTFDLNERVDGWSGASLKARVAKGR